MRNLSADLARLEQRAKRSNIDLYDARNTIATCAAEYAFLSFSLPPTEAWRWKKLEDAAAAARHTRDLATENGVSEVLATTLECGAFCADIGRLILRLLLLQLNEPVNQLHHGTWSADFVRQKSTTLAGDALGEALLCAIAVHSHRENPTLDTVGGDEAALALCLILRDLDRLGNWLSGDEYLKRRKMDAEMAVWGFTEAPYIPEETIAAFLRSEPVDRASAETYAGYMLQFLSWGYQFSYPKLWDEALATGNPRRVLQYIGEQLKSSGHNDRWLQIKKHAENTLGITTT